MSSKTAQECSFLALGANLFLFIIKLIAGIYSGSIALISDALNSFTDIVASLALVWSVKVSRKKADHDHPFGHSRAEPVGGMIVAIIAALIAFEIIKESFMSLFSEKTIFVNEWIIAVILCTICFKGILYIFFRHVSRKHKAPSIRAIAIDSINDVLVTFAVLVSIILYMFSVPYVDGIVGILIGFFVLHNGIVIGLENMGYLLGQAPSEEIMKKIIATAKSIKHVNGVHDIRAHYVGVYVHLELHVEVDVKTTLQMAHDIEKATQRALEKEDFIEKAFIHVDAR